MVSSTSFGHVYTRGQYASDDVERNRPVSVYRHDEMPIQTCGQSVSAPRGKAGARLNSHKELRTKRQRSAREVTYRRPVLPCPPRHRLTFDSRNEGYKCVG